jgi:hypothetical protein
MPSPFFRKVGFKPYLTEKSERLSIVETDLLYYLCFDKPLKRLFICALVCVPQTTLATLIVVSGYARR